MIHRSSGALSVRVLGAAALLVFLPSRANAYGWMIQHGYTSCAVCHADPSGGTGPLTPYGRAQGEILLQSTYGKPPGEEAGPATGFLWGVLKTPEWLLAGGGVRLMPTRRPRPGRAPCSRRLPSPPAHGDSPRAAGAQPSAPT